MQPSCVERRPSEPHGPSCRGANSHLIQRPPLHAPRRGTKPNRTVTVELRSLFGTMQMRLNMFGSAGRSAGAFILLYAAIAGLAAAQVSPSTSVQWTVDGGLRDGRQLFLRTALMPSWQGTWGFDHVRLSYATAFPSGGGMCYASFPGHCTGDRGYRSYAAADIGHSFDLRRSARRDYQLLIAPGVIYGYGNAGVGGPQFGTLVRATVRTINHWGHGGDLHLQVQHGMLRRTTVEVGVGFHLRVWSGA